MEVKKSQHKYIIGPKGNTLQEILEATGVSVEMPPLDSGSETIILRGEPDKLGPALTQVYAKVRRRGKVESEAVNVNRIKTCKPFCLRAGEERDGGGGDRSGLAASLHHRQERTEHRADHTAATAGKKRGIQTFLFLFFSQHDRTLRTSKISVAVKERVTVGGEEGREIDK